MAGTLSRQDLERLLSRGYFLALRIAGRPEWAEEAVQEAWVGFLERPPAGPGVEAHFLRSVHGRALDLLRSEGARARREAAVGGEDLRAASAAGVRPDREVGERELAASARAALAKLPLEQRQAVALCCELDCSHADAAQILGVPRRTVSSWVEQGLERLRKDLAASGFVVAGAAALAQALGKLELPALPAALQAEIVRAGTVKLGAPAAAKGGMAMKIVAGVVVAGVLAGIIAVVNGVGAGRRPAPTSSPPATPAPIERKDPAPDQAYKVEPVPVGGTSMGYTVDDAANLFTVDSATPTVWRYEPAKRRTTLISGSAFGVLDGPLDRARFGGWAYNQPSSIQVSGDGQRAFVRERSGLWRLIDLKAGVVKTLFPYMEKNGAHNVIVRDKSGELYVFKTSGEEPPENPAYKKLKVAPFKNPFEKGKTGHYIGYMDGYALDAEKMRFYWHARGDVMCCDLKTGEVTNLNPGPKRAVSTTGDIKSWKPYCPAGLSISPSGRFIYVGGGDDDTCWRFDLEKDRCDALGWNAATETLSFGEKAKGWKPIPANLTFWPNVVVFAPDGSAYWATQGCMRLTPAK